MVEPWPSKPLMTVQIRLPAPIRDVAQFGSAPALGAGCRWFESSHPDHILAAKNRGFYF